MRPITVLKLGAKATGGAGSLDSQTVTVGTAGTAIGGDRFRGYTAGPPGVVGSISDGTSNIYGGAPILTLCWEEGTGYKLSISGTQVNSGWTSLTIAGTVTLTSATASFSHIGGNTQWVWNQGTAGSQAFGTSGNKVVGFN